MWENADQSNCDYGHFPRSVVSKKARTWRLKKNLWAKTNFYQKQCLPVMTWNEKHLSKQVAPITDSLEKSFFEFPTFEGL